MDLAMFLLCFCNPAKSWKILCKLYEIVIPEFLYPIN